MQYIVLDELEKEVNETSVLHVLLRRGTQSSSPSNRLAVTYEVCSAREFGPVAPVAMWIELAL